MENTSNEDQKIVEVTVDEISKQLLSQIDNPKMIAEVINGVKKEILNHYNSKLKQAGQDLEEAKVNVEYVSHM